ncbi:MAG: hypothetical protein AB8B96_21835 [Lysobacterales bacterium]
MKVSESQLARASGNNFFDPAPASQLATLCKPTIDNDLREALLGLIDTFWLEIE